MPDIYHELLIGTGPEVVYKSITTKEGLSAWWTPGTEAKPEMDSIAHFPFGPAYYKEMKIVALKPAEMVKWLCLAGAAEWVGTSLTFQLIPVNKNSLLKAYPEAEGQLQQQDNFSSGTLLIFHHDNWQGSTPMYAECNYTWGQFLKSLKLLCETGKGRPWPNQHLL